jgi:hypothetical protein
MAPRRAAVAGEGEGACAAEGSEAFAEGAVAMAEMSMLIDNFSKASAREALMTPM